ncbi:MAG: carboxypeptidase-like regulatory domain-containing protein [Butyricimonas faecihominis]
MPGVTVKVEGVNIGTATNAKGWFAIALPMTKGALEFSFVGYKKEIVEFTEHTGYFTCDYERGYGRFGRGSCSGLWISEQERDDFCYFFCES